MSDSTASKGNPKVLVRLEPDLLKVAQEVFPAVKGKSGGLALALRRLLCVALDCPLPPQYGADEVELTDPIEALEDTLRVMERAGSRPSKARIERARTELKGLAERTSDPIDLLRVRCLLGRLELLQGAPSSGRSEAKEAL